MDLIQLKNFLSKEQPYRLQQAQKALFIDLIEDWREASALPLLLRKNLNKICPIHIKAQVLFSKDEKTAKAIIILKDGLKIESVLMKHSDSRNTVCVSSQVGCALNCSFCATGKIGFKRNLEVFEIVEQVLFFARYLKKKGEKVTNNVFMGMGEPFLNYENTISAIRILNDKEGFNLGARHISISTAGILEGIKKLAEEKLQVNLAISLHAPDDDLRSKIMPINKTYPIVDVLEAVDDYIKKTKRKVMFEYLMVKDLNDSDVHAQRLSKLMKKSLYLVNLILYNPTGVFKPSSSVRIKKFKEILRKKGVQVTQRYRFGQNIKAACGQLVS
ncbi:23S rRNA (adenine(2503)-C(2))-methyltransferase RlmN [Patescibacteria group bacterium]|nr:23S rRNA (adenine(2503)-C(2))-methyltransferase RlmN [Patescibacteria group bacterium]